MGYKNPSDVQKRVIPEALDGKDIVVKSQTGSGKTAAFAIPLCEKVIWDNSKPQALVLTPTRELAIQVKEEIQSLGRLKRIRAAAVFGKQPFSEQIRELNYNFKCLPQGKQTNPLLLLWSVLAARTTTGPQGSLSTSVRTCTHNCHPR